MNQVALETDVHRRITEFVRGRFLDGDPQEELRDDTPLLELGVINSMNVAQLLALIQNDLGVQVPLSVITQTTLQ
ncbi:MAG: peptidyl carrier protein, partial [Actinomycetota bacterium]|nr:peptidyl carrier protein [Actinomycetota bacterium]